MSDIIRITKRIQEMYEERNRLFQDTGLGAFTYSDEEIMAFIVEKIEKELANMVDKSMKESGI